MLNLHQHLNLGINYFDDFRIRVNFGGNCLKQEKVTFTQKQVVNIYIVCYINLWQFTVVQILTLENLLFGAVNWLQMLILLSINILTYGIGFYVNRSFSLSDGSGFGKNVTIFEDKSSSVYMDDKNKDFLVQRKVQRNS